MPLGAWREAPPCFRRPLRELTVIDLDHADATILPATPLARRFLDVSSRLAIVIFWS
jgi:hypothetical protein